MDKKNQRRGGMSGKRLALKVGSDIEIENSCQNKLCQQSYNV
jgi:hypothetical protein